MPTLPAAYDRTARQSTDSTGPTTVASGVTGTSWTSGSLPDGNDHYVQVLAQSGRWLSAASATTPRRHVASGNCS